MSTRWHDPGAASVGSSSKRILHDSRTPEGSADQLWDWNMEGHLAALRIFNLWQIIATKAPRDVAPNVREE